MTTSSPPDDAGAPSAQTARPVGPGDHVFLVDGSSFVFRAYFQSIRRDPKYNYRSDALPTGAVRGALPRGCRHALNGDARGRPSVHFRRAVARTDIAPGP